MKRQMMMLANLNCPTCAAKLAKAAGALPGMKSAKVAFGSGTLNVEYDETILAEAEIRAVVNRLGVDVAAVVAGRA
ncbi:MAG: heavy-metal-associated domain-containing protein [Mycobacterium leprae]